MKRPLADYRPLGPFAATSSQQSNTFFGDNVTISQLCSKNQQGQLDAKKIEDKIKKNTGVKCKVGIDNASKYFPSMSGKNIGFAQTNESYLRQDTIINVSYNLLSGLGDQGYNNEMPDTDTSYTNSKYGNDLDMVAMMYFAGEGP